MPLRDIRSGIFAYSTLIMSIEEENYAVRYRPGSGHNQFPRGHL